MKKLTILSIMLIVISNSFSQTTSRNGYWMHNTDTVRILLLIAEVNDYAADVSPHPNWPKGELPLNADDWFDAEFTGEENIHGELTKYFYQASFGNFIVLGDYIDTLFSVDSASVAGYGDSELIAFVNSLSGTDIITKKGKSLNTDFDFVTNPGSGMFGTYKTRTSDNYIDILMPVWRTNKGISTSDGSGATNSYTVATTIKGSDGYMSIARCLDYTGQRFGLARHEFGHTLFGGNDFHTCGPGFGEKTFICNTGGYSCMGSWDNTYNGFNAWDRFRMGWKQTGDTYYIGAINPATSAEVNTDYNYNDAFPSGSNGEFILRDFVTTGDAVRVKLPYLLADDPAVKDQYIWIENHHLLEGNFDISAPAQKGIYAFIQVGKEGLTTFSLGPNDYLWWLNAFGNYDVEMDTTTGEMSIDTDLENPLTGYHFWTSPPVDLNGDDKIKRGEVIFPYGVKVDGTNLPASDFVSGFWPGYGTKYDAFLEGDEISTSSNPASIPIYSYRTSSSNTADPSSLPQPGDNTTIRLNGISIEVLEQQTDGDIKIKIRWNDYAIENDVRWCGNITLHDSLYVTNAATLKLDQGLTPTRPVNPVLFQGEKIFADTTVLL